MVTSKVSRTVARGAKVRVKGKVTLKSKRRLVGTEKSSTKVPFVAGIATQDLGMSPEQLGFQLPKPTEHFFIANVSCFSLRNSNGRVRQIDPLDHVEFGCSLCKRKKKLGKSSELFTRLSYFLGEEQCHLVLCDHCCDVICDLARHGPQVMATSWQVRSRMHKVSAVNEKLMCYSCLSVWDTHVVFRFGDHRTLDFGGVRRVCARCIITYLEIIRQEKKFDSSKKPYECARKIQYGYS